ncbi:MAG: cobalt-precorrin-5B (C(1))-methyltransferase CbiD [Desulfobulbaceae bacterium]|nr:cobalt-precorrin-5B (C(1))-methyltransferase CbiD [Desulfobulbaceae bacterium]
MARRLRSGYTTGACAAAASKAAALLLVNGVSPEAVDIPFPDGSRHRFAVLRTENGDDGFCRAAIVKDAGDDPDVTNGAEIVAAIRWLPEDINLTGHIRIGAQNIVLGAGVGVGIVTKPGLAVKPGEPAINPVPRQMIHEALLEGLADKSDRGVQVVISVPNGDVLAEKTLNHRLGVVGGLSILGTTGIVRPVSAEAWTATILASLDVARAAGLNEVVLSTGRTSERGVQDMVRLPEEAYAMMGDYLEFSLKNAALRGFEKIHLAGMWAKIMKAAMKIPQTHVRHGALEMKDGAAFLKLLGAEGALLKKLESSNTAREMFGHLVEAGRTDLVLAVCERARVYGEDVAKVPVRVYLVDSHAKVVQHVG